MSKIDRACASVTVDDAGLLRIDEVPVFKLLKFNGGLWVQIKDGNRQRCRVRGSDCVMVPVDLLIAKVIKEAVKRGG